MPAADNDASIDDVWAAAPLPGMPPDPHLGTPDRHHGALGTPADEPQPSCAPAISRMHTESHLIHPASHLAAPPCPALLDVSSSTLESSRGIGDPGPAPPIVAVVRPPSPSRSPRPRDFALSVRTAAGLAARRRAAWSRLVLRSWRLVCAARRPARAAIRRRVAVLEAAREVHVQAAVLRAWHACAHAKFAPVPEIRAAHERRRRCTLLLAWRSAAMASRSARVDAERWEAEKVSVQSAHASLLLHPSSHPCAACASCHTSLSADLPPSV